MSMGGSASMQEHMAPASMDGVPDATAERGGQLRRNAMRGRHALARGVERLLGDARQRCFEIRFAQARARRG